jgi:thioredoxin 1
MVRALFQIVFALVFAVSVQAAGNVAIYDELADATRDIAAAVAQANAEKKQVLLIFGANWCGSCRALNEEMNAADLGSLLAEKFVVVKVDVARFKKNTEVAEKYGVSIGRGIPAAGIVSAEGKTVTAVDGAVMERIIKGGRPSLIKFFDKGIIDPPKPKWYRPSWM